MEKIIYNPYTVIIVTSLNGETSEMSYSTDCSKDAARFSSYYKVGKYLSNGALVVSKRRENYFKKSKNKFGG